MSTKKCKAPTTLSVYQAYPFYFVRGSKVLEFSKHFWNQDVTKKLPLQMKKSHFESQTILSQTDIKHC